MYFEADILSGLKFLAEPEIRQLGGKPFHHAHPEVLPFEYAGYWPKLSHLRLCNGVFVVLPFPVPRPKALLGHQVFHQILQVVNQVREQYPAHTFRTLYLSAAGQDSAVFQRLKQELASHTKLTLAEKEGDLFMRVRRTPAGWEVLVRLTPRPLTSRSWRKVNYPGALNGPAAAALVALARPQPGEKLLNLMCGSGSLLAEQALMAPAGQVVGLDIDRLALQAAGHNVGELAVVNWLQADANFLPLADNCFEVVLADWPWGHLWGDHKNNERFYSRWLAETGRVSQPGGRFVLITHEVRLFERVLADQPAWQLLQTVHLKQGNLTPRIYLLHNHKEA